jgi:preprotein translocase subunit SecE
MAKDNPEGSSGWWALLLAELFRAAIYKRNQGRLVRQFTCLAVWVIVALAAWRMHEYLRIVATGLPGWLAYVVPVVVLAAGMWAGYRLVNYPPFADFLIAVEAELNKVAWPSRAELVRASVVVIVLMFGLTLVLFTYDTLLVWFLRTVLQVT